MLLPKARGTQVLKALAHDQWSRPVTTRRAPVRVMIPNRDASNSVDDTSASVYLRDSLVISISCVDILKVDIHHERAEMLQFFSWSN